MVMLCRIKSGYRGYRRYDCRQEIIRDPDKAAKFKVRLLSKGASELSRDLAGYLHYAPPSHHQVLLLVQSAARYRQVPNQDNPVLHEMVCVRHF